MESAQEIWQLYLYILEASELISLVYALVCTPVSSE